MISIPSIYRAGKCFFVIQDAGRSIRQKKKNAYINITEIGREN